jgi:hypothetical protein
MKLYKFDRYYSYGPIFSVMAENVEDALEYLRLYLMRMSKNDVGYTNDYIQFFTDESSDDGTISEHVLGEVIEGYNG